MVIRRSAAALAAFAATGVLVTGCATGPGQAGSAAIVGSNAISLDSVQSELNTVLADRPAAPQGQTQTTPDDEARSILTEQVMAKVISAAIGRYHLNVTSAQETQFLSGSGGLQQLMTSSGLDQATAQEYVHQQVAAADYASQVAARLVLHFDVVQVADQQTATNLANRIAANGTHAISILQSAAGAGSQAELNQSLTGGALISEQIQINQQAQQSGDSSSGASVLPLLTASANTVLAFPSGQGQWVVVLVTGVDTNGAPSAQDKSTLSQLGASDLAGVGTYLLSPLAQQLGIKISPRYGIWDPVGMQVVASTTQAAGIEVPVHSTQS